MKKFATVGASIYERHGLVVAKHYDDDGVLALIISLPNKGYSKGENLKESIRKEK